MTKLTPQLQKKFIHLLQLGMPHKYACESCDISEQIYHVWMKHGKKEKKGKYVEFFESVQRTKSEALSRKLVYLEQACINGSVTAIIWWLEHNHPELYRQPADVNLNVKPDVKYFIEFLDSPEYHKLRDQKRAKTAQANDVFQQPHTLTPVQRLPTPIKKPTVEEPDDLIPFNPDEDEEEEENHA